jgi:hypothetical protein
MSRRALLIGVPGGGINVKLAAERLTLVLRRLGFSKIEECTGDRASRAGILAALDRLLEHCEPDDAIFIHYFGHGGRVHFTDLGDDRVFGYVTCTKNVRGGGFEGVLDIELSSRLTELDARCGNVTVMLDCCYSGELVRSGEDEEEKNVRLASHRSEPTPDWVRQVLATPPKHDLALDSHPRILRLCGASAKQEAYAAERGGRHIGRMTEAFLEAIEEAGEHWEQLCWSTFGHRLREHVIAALRMEAQWVALAGPRARRLFSTEIVDLPGTVTFVPADEPGYGWLRAGWLQGVAAGDRWAIIDPRVDAEAGPRIVVTATVESAERSRSRVKLDAEATVPPGAPAIVLAVGERFRVEVDDLELREHIERSAWLAVGQGAEVAARVRREGDLFVVESIDGSSLPTHVEGSARTLALLEDRARVWAVLRSLAGNEPTACPVRWRWSLIDSPEAPLPESGASLQVGERVRIDLELPDGPPWNWFVSVVLIDPAGRPRLLNTRMPEGIELAPLDSEVIGVRRGRRGAQGIELRWPSDVDGQEGPASLLLLTSRRPIELGHLVHPQALDDDDALALQGLAGQTMRSIKKPEPTQGCAWGRFHFRLRR